MTSVTADKQGALGWEGRVVVPLGFARWCEKHWFSTQRRRNPGAVLKVVAKEGDDPVEIVISDPNGHELKWNQLVHSQMKKIKLEDLGDMNSTMLESSIKSSKWGPTMTVGEGWAQILALEKLLGVAVVFLNNRHVLLVGSPKKLEKKCIELRNILEHFSWRLSGKTADFQTMVAT
jgi:hypothetical protein